MDGVRVMLPGKMIAPELQISDLQVLDLEVLDPQASKRAKTLQPRSF